MKGRYSFLFLGWILCLSVYAQDTGTPHGEAAADSGKYLFSAVSKTLFANALLTGINDHVFKFPWAGPTLESINGNITGEWIWEDTDGFSEIT